jgi:hypothetical protein
MEFDLSQKLNKKEATVFREKPLIFSIYSHTSFGILEPLSRTFKGQNM